MRAVVVDGSGHPSVGEHPAPEPGPGEALIDVHLAGICGTDLELARGYMGYRGIPGHEFVGTVAKVLSPADRVLLGSRVVGEINIGCEDCPRCAEGLSRHCPRRKVLGILHKQGAFAEHLTLPVSNLHTVPESIADETAVLIEPLAAAYEILDQIVLGPEDKILVLGDGRLGQIIAHVLATGEARVTLAGRHPAKMTRAREAGLHVVESPTGIPVDPPFDVVVEATGNPAALDLALARVRPRGTIILKSTCATPTTFDASVAVVNEITILGSRCGRFEPAIEALESGSIVLDRLISRRFPIEEAPEAFRTAGDGESLKVLLDIDTRS